MEKLQKSILATIIYYDILDFALTQLEVYKYLINPKRLANYRGTPNAITFNQVVEGLDRLSDLKIIDTKNGFYFLAGRDDLYTLRIEREKISAQKWKKFLRYCYWLQLAPYLRGMFAGGSMALGNTDEKSDFDVLVIIESGKLYTSRLFLWLISSFIGKRRKKNEKIAPDKLCFNHYIANNTLSIPHQSLFNAQSYVNLKPVFIDPIMVDKFYQYNSWITDYVCNFEVQKEFVRRSIAKNSFFLAVAKMVEIILDNFFGNTIEKYLKNIQQNRIKSDPTTYESGGRIIFNDNELEFHPRSFEAVVLEKYNKNLKRYGILLSVEEKDSGLL